MTNLSYRCYILPLVGMLAYLVFSMPAVNIVFHDWIPDYQYATVMKSLLVLIILFITCRIMDLIWDPCHHNPTPTETNTDTTTSTTTSTETNTDTTTSTTTSTGTNTDTTTSTGTNTDTTTSTGTNTDTTTSTGTNTDTTTSTTTSTDTLIPADIPNPPSLNLEVEI